MVSERAGTYAALALVVVWPLVLALGITLILTGQLWGIGFLTFCAASSIGIGQLALHFYRHGLDNHLCGRKCCWFYR